MTSLRLRIAGLGVSFCWGEDVGEGSHLASYEPFQAEGGAPVCSIRVQRGIPPGWEDPHGGDWLFHSAGAWAAFRWADGWGFVCPEPNQMRWQRLLFWSPRERVADLWLAPGVPPSDLLENLALPFFACVFSSHRGILVHAAAWEVQGQAWVFAGPSGAGKSHWARRWQERGGKVIEEERVVLREIEGGIWAFGTPWHLETCLCSPSGAPLERLFFLQSTGPDGLPAIRPAAATTLLLRSTFFPVYDPAMMQSVLDVAGRAALQAQSFLLGHASGEGVLDRLLAL